MPTLKYSQSINTPTGPINSTSGGTPQTLTGLDTHIAEKDIIVAGAFFAQATAITIPNASALLKASTDGTGSVRSGAVYWAIVEDPADFATIVFQSPSTSSRVPVMVQVWSPDSGKHFVPGTVICTGPEYASASAASDTYPSLGAGVTRDLTLGIAMSNKSASSTLSTHTAAGGGTNLTQARILSDGTASPADSVVSIARGGTGVSFTPNQANAVMYSFGINQADDTVPVDPLPTVTGKGWGTVKKFLRTFGATMAHRALGLTYPELTEYAIRMAANAGHGIIELSCQRDSEGTWWCIHDQTPDRVAVETTYDGQQISSLTTAQMRTLTVNVGSSGAPKPFATLQEAIATLPSDFIFMVDPKQSGGTTAYMTEFLDIIDSLLGPTRAILKFDGAATSARFIAAKARGYVTSAYYYAAPATATSSSLVNANLPYCDIPGLNYDATQAGWDDFLAPGGAYYSNAGGLGKKMWGHVCPDQTAYNTAISKGATYVQSTSATITAVGVDKYRGSLLDERLLSMKELYLGSNLLKALYIGDEKLYERV